MTIQDTKPRDKKNAIQTTRQQNQDHNRKTNRRAINVSRDLFTEGWRGPWAALPSFGVTPGDRGTEGSNSPEISVRKSLKSPVRITTPHKRIPRQVSRCNLYVTAPKADSSIGPTRQKSRRRMEITQISPLPNISTPSSPENAIRGPQKT